MFGFKKNKLEKISKIAKDSGDWLAFKIYYDGQGLMPLDNEVNKFMGMYLYMVAGVVDAKVAQDFLYSQTKDYTPEYKNKIENELNSYYQETREIADLCMRRKMPIDDIIVRFVDYYLLDSNLKETPETRADLYVFFSTIYDLLRKV